MSAGSIKLLLIVINPFTRPKYLPVITLPFTSRTVTIVPIETVFTKRFPGPTPCPIPGLLRPVVLRPVVLRPGDLRPRVLGNSFHHLSLLILHTMKGLSLTFVCLY